jgi:hypothetical protein
MKTTVTPTPINMAVARTGLEVRSLGKRLIAARDDKECEELITRIETAVRELGELLRREP